MMMPVSARDLDQSLAYIRKCVCVSKCVYVSEGKDKKEEIKLMSVMYIINHLHVEMWRCVDECVKTVCVFKMLHL